MLKLSYVKYRVACCLTETGDSDEQIAKKNGIGLSTVKQHIKQIRHTIRKEMNVEIKSRLQLALFLIRNGFERKLTKKERRKQNG